MKIAFLTLGTIKSSLSYRPLSLAKELVKEGHEVYILAPRFDKYSHFKDERITEIDGVKILRPMQIKSIPFDVRFVPYIFSLVFILLRLNPDVIHIYKANPLTVFGVIFKYIHGKKIIFDTDDIDSEVMKMEKHSWLKILLVELSEKIISATSDAIITGSIYLKDEYISKYTKKVIVHIPNGAEFLKTNYLLSSKLEGNKIVFVGNINRITILEPLFKALRALTDSNIQYSAIIIGDGKCLTYFKKLTEKLSLTSHITFLGRINQENLQDYLQAGDIGYSYMPNEITQKACSNMKVFQYMQNGVIPLVSDIGDLPLYVSEGRGGYIVKNSDMNSLITTIEKALSDKEDRRKKLAYIIENAPQKYSWRVLAKKVEAVYEK